MVDRYITVEDVEKDLEVDPFNETDDPKLSKVVKWITASEEEIDDLTQQRWDKHQIVGEDGNGELISPTCQTDTFILKVRPLVTINLIQEQLGDQWNPSWSTVAIADYRIFNKAISQIRTRNVYASEESLRVKYEAGYDGIDAIPLKIKELAKMLVKKRYIMNQLGIAAADTEIASVAVIRLQDKSNASLKFKTDALQKDIDSTLGRIKRMKAKNFNMGVIDVSNYPRRYKLYRS